ncbi:TonB-dependent receptor plug domain-containing protein [Accumulibacter sp.]|uniref:TonB-dependent receptor plug domain-containing protein n=1 Tax=Accumulibacter sp. TaxID=2053492 RepID=UPI0035B32B61
MNTVSCLSPRRASRPEWPLNACLIALLLTAAQQAARADQELTELSLEQLMDVTIVSAAKFSQRLSEVPSAVTVISRGDIQQYGWRTLAEALRSVPGFYIHSDRTYAYIGARGFARPQDYNSRMLLLIDGQRTNDAIYDMAYVGSEQLIDLDLVDRIEVVRGPGSSVYGGNALFGVINVITRTAQQIDGLEVAASYASFDTVYGSATYGKRLDNGAEVVASLSGMDSKGPDLYFPEFDAPESNFGRTSGTAFDRNSRFYVRLSQEGLSLTAAASQRQNGNPAALYGVLFDDPSNRQSDSQAYVNLNYTRQVAADSELSARLYWGDYSYRSHSDYAAEASDDPPVRNRDGAQGNWWGSEVKLVTAWSARNKLVSGIEYQSNYRQKQWTYDENPYQSYLDDLRNSQRGGVFAQNDFQWTEAVKVSLGARYDKVGTAAGEISPRLGLVFRSSEQTLWKLLYGSAFRPGNVYEKFYTYPEQQIANSQLQPETLKTWEAGVEHYLGKQTRVAATAYYYNMEHLIEQVTDPETGLLQYRNVGDVKAQGLELEGEHQWDNGARLRLSLDLPRTQNAQGEQLSNSPRTVGKLLGSLPLPWMRLRLGAEGQWLSSRKTDAGTSVPSYGVVNLTLLRPMANKSWQLSASVFNLFDEKFTDPAAPDLGVPSRDRFEQDGRTFRVKAVYRF